MAKREEVIKKKEALEELELAAETQPLTKNNVEFMSPVNKKKKRKKLRKTKSALGPTRNQFSRSYVFDTRRDRDKGSVKVIEKVLQTLQLISSLIFLVWRDDNNKHNETSRNSQRHQIDLPYTSSNLSRQSSQPSCNFTVWVESGEVEEISGSERNVDERQVSEGKLGR